MNIQNKKSGKKSADHHGFAAAAFLLLTAGIMTAIFAARPEKSLCAAAMETDMDKTVPEEYNAREHGRAAAVRSQGKQGTCWALSACSGLEAAMLPDQKIVFSAQHMVQENSFSAAPSDGGDYKMIMAYLCGWQGPREEKADDSSAEAAVHVQEIRFLTDPDPVQIKKAVLVFGGVQTSLCMDRKMTRSSENYYNMEKRAFYDPVEEQVTHDVLIVGWDDNFSRDNFRQRPERDGAWICQNTWGEKFGDRGIFYVSYEDANIAQSGLVFSGIESADNYDHLYQTDACGWQGRVGFGPEGCMMANVYTAQGEEELDAVGFYCVGPDSDYEVYLAHDFVDTNSLQDRELCGSGHFDEAGYYTVRLEEPRPLHEGERFAVIVRIRTEGVEKSVAAEMKKDLFTQSVSLSGKEGYISQSGTEWINVEKTLGINVCLKAYTKDRGR